MNPREVAQLNDFLGFLSFKPTWAFKKYMKCTQKKVALFTGNQAMKTSSVAISFVYSVLGFHPVPEKNVVYWKCPEKHKYNALTYPSSGICHCGGKIEMHKRNTRTIRFASETLPGESGTTGDKSKTTEIKNTQYPEFKKWLPPMLIKKDITHRNPSLIIKDIYGGDDIIIEFVSYNQSTQATAGVQRVAVWLDEEPPKDFYDEQLPRLLAEEGWLVLSLTPANFITWTFDELFEKAEVYYRTQAIVDFINKVEDRDIKRIEHTSSGFSIAVVQAATDDNPTLSKHAIDEMFDSIDDPDVMAIRRYGIFKQVSGRIFKDFEYSIHVQPKEKYFPYGIPGDWVHAQGIDAHPQTPWHYGAISLSPTDEAFIWGEAILSPETLTTLDIAKNIAAIGHEHKFYPSLIDPIAEAIKKDTVSVKEDLNRIFHELNKNNQAYPTYWEGWDTRGDKGRDEVRKRLKNARLCGRPFNNKIVENGQVKHLPTLWVLDNCKHTAKYMKLWRWDEWVDARSRTTKDEKNVPQQKWSHLNMVWECIFKHQAFKARRSSGRNYEAPHYFKGAV